MNTSPGIKADQGKLMAAIIFQDFPRAIQKLCLVAHQGAEKYDRGQNWKKVENKEERYQDARSRHFLKSFYEKYDDESKVSHLAHEAWNCLALLEMELESE